MPSQRGNAAREHPRLISGVLLILLAEASLEFFVHYQLIGSVPSFEIVDLIGNSGGIGAWDGDRDSGGVSGLYCFRSSMLPTTEGGHRRIEIPNDCFALIFEPLKAARLSSSRRHFTLMSCSGLPNKL